MQLLFLVCIFFLSQQGFAQLDSSNKLSTLTLDNVTVSRKNKKIKTVRLRGFPTYKGLGQTDAVVSFVGNIPAGTSKSVSFYFNTGLVNHLKKRLNITYRDVTLGLLIFKARADTTVGEMISENEIQFVVPASHRGAFNINLSGLNIQQQDIFIGFSVISKLPKEENNIYVRYNEAKQGKTYEKLRLPGMTQDWQKTFFLQPVKLKLDLEIIQ